MSAPCERVDECRFGEHVTDNFVAILGRAVMEKTTVRRYELIRGRLLHLQILTGLILLAAGWLVSCDSMYVDDGDSDIGITTRGGYYYLIDNGTFELRMLDPKLSVMKSWSLAPLGADTRAQGLAFDGKNLWISMAGSIDRIFQVDASGDSLAVLRSLNAPPDGRGTIRGITYDGTNLWAINSGSATYAISPTLYKLDPTDGSVLAEYTYPESGPRALAWAGETGAAYGNGAESGVYIADVDLDKIYRFRTDISLTQEAFASPEPPRGADYIFPCGLTFDGSDFWLINSSSSGDHLYKLDYKGIERERVELPFPTPGPIAWATGDVRTANAPTVTAVSPNTGTRGGSVIVSVAGTDFRPGDGLAVDFGAGITTVQATFVDGNSITAIIDIAPDADFGPRDVTVTNPDGQTAVGDSLFTILSIDPNSGFIWLTDGNADLLYKIRISDTSIVQQWDLTQVAPGGSPQGLTFDGTNLWLCAGGTDDKLIKLNTSGATLDEIESITAPPEASGIAREVTFDGTSLWTANSTTDQIYKQDPATGNILDSIPTPGDEARGVVFADGDLYCNDRIIDTVFVYDFDASTWTAVFGTPIPPNGTESNRYATGMCWDGVNFWIANSTYEFDYLFQVSIDGVVLRTYEVPDRDPATPTGIAFTQD